MENIENGRAIIDERFNEIKITIPTKKNWFIIIFFCVWLSGWFFGETSALYEISNSNEAEGFLSFWLIGWTIGGLIACFTVLWMLFGQEVIIVDNNLLSVHRNIFGIGIKKEYGITEIKKIRIDASYNYSSNMWGRNRGLDYIGLKGGIIKFDYGFKTISIGAAIDEAEGEFILNKIRNNKLIPENSFK
ncbi:MAG: hypothetical protein U0W24_04670 [Bacteroidales bacterium]